MIKVICAKSDVTRNTETGFYVDYSVTLIQDGQETLGGNFEVFLTGEENIQAFNAAVVNAGKAWTAANGITAADKDIWFDAVGRG